MYSWGDDTHTWQRPGYQYGTSRRSYMERDAEEAARTGPRTYRRRQQPTMEIVTTKNRPLHTESQNPLVVAIDVTGSMAHWPAEIFDRLPLLYQTLANYRQDLEISFAVIGDAYTDHYPLQVAPFGKGPQLDDYLKALCAEGGGGGQAKESYELFAYYLLHHCHIQAEKPFLLLYGDEGFYPDINKGQVQHYIGDSLEGRIESMQLWRQLTQKFDIRLLRKSYEWESEEHNILEQWSQALGRERILELPNAERAVDYAMGLIARQWGQLGEFEGNMKARQDESTVSQIVTTVNEAYRNIPSMMKELKR